MGPEVAARPAPLPVDVRMQLPAVAVDDAASPVEGARRVLWYRE